MATKSAAEELNGEAALDPCLSSYVDRGSTESHRYYLSRRTAMEMLRDRGYNVQKSDIDLSLDEFRVLHGDKPDADRLRISASLCSDPSNKILVVFFGPGKVKLNGIRSIADEVVNKETLSRMILIVESEITKQAQKAVECFSFKVELFHITDLLVNITKHALKPKHRLLTDDEKQRLLKKFSVEEKQLPRMLQRDAIARYFGLEKGQVVKVTYSGEITESHVTYRCVW